MEFFGTFRGRLLLIFAFLIVTTLGVQYYLNLYMQNENDERRALSEKALKAGFVLGVNGITSGEYMEDVISVPGQRFLDDQDRERILDIIVISEKRKVPKKSIRKNFL